MNRFSLNEWFIYLNRLNQATKLLDLQITKLSINLSFDAEAVC